MVMPKRIRRPLALMLAVFALAAPLPRAQARQTTTPQPQTQPPAREQTPPPATREPDEQDEVLQVNTELAQTGVGVFDKKGKFVGGLRPEQFELKVDGRAREISFLDEVSAGGPGDLARPGTAATPAGETSASAAAAPAAEAARTIYFFVDDLHLAPSSSAGARRAVENYVGRVMADGDSAAVVSTSGRVGFLQQLTDDKTVLRAAVRRLGIASRAASDMERPPISVGQAHAVQEQSDQLTLQYLISETLRHNPGLTTTAAESLVTSRVRGIMGAAASSTKATLQTLIILLRRASERRGRKIVFFLSEGFLLQNYNSEDRELMRRVSDAAARAEAVIYPLDARGLATDPDFDASREDAFDPYARQGAASIGARSIRISQEPMRQLADDTGGRAVINTNDLDAGLARALEETSRYYVLAWRPDAEAQAARAGGDRFRKLEVKIAGRPDLAVRVHRGYFAAPPAAAAKGANGVQPKRAAADAATNPQAELRAALVAAYPKTELPVTIAAAYTAVPGGGGGGAATLTASLRVGSESLIFKPAAEAAGRVSASLDMSCVVLDDEGKIVGGLNKHSDIKTPAPGAGGGPPPSRDVVHHFKFELRPGLYQVRAVARDAASGRVGGAARWVEIPDVSRGRLALSVLALGEIAAASGDAAAAAAPVRINYGQPVARGSRLQFSAQVYNAARGAGAQQSPPRVTVRAVVAGGGRELVDTGAREIQTDGLGDLSRLPHSDELDLAGLPAGRYRLDITATDALTGASVTQSVRFTIR